MHNNMNVNVSGPVQPTSTYKTKVLKGQVPFATQVTEPNTKYVIKHNFVLNGDVTIPENCILEFDGGGLYNGTIISNETILEGDKVGNAAYTGHYTDRSYSELKTEVDALNEAIGSGGAVDIRIEAAVAPKANSSDVYSKNESYNKSETYNKTELNNMITTPNQEYESYAATDLDTDVHDILPAEGSADTVYRVGNWDGTQYNDSVFSEYAWNGSAYIKLSTKSQIEEVYDISANHADTKYADLADALGTDGENIPSNLRKGGMSVKYVQSPGNRYIRYNLLSDSFTIDTTQWAIDDGGIHIENLEFIEAKTDREGNLLEARRSDGTKVEYNDLRVKGEIYNEGIQDQKEKLNEVSGKIEDLDIDALKSIYNCENSEYVQVTLDAEERILDGITKDGIRKAAEAPDTKTDEEIEEYECNQDIRLYPAYKDYVNGKIVEINQKILSGSSRALNFFFVTDTHINDGVNISAADNPRMVSAEVLSKLMGESLCRKLVFGGDFIGYNNIDINQDIINHQKYVDAAYKHGGEFIPVRGNHETIFMTPEWNTYPQRYTRNVIFNPIKTDSGFVFNEDDDTSCYYYKDFKHKKLRVFVLDSTDATEEDMQIGVIHVFGARQLQWVCDRINETPSGYDIVFFSHVPVISTCTTTEWIWRNAGVHVREMLKHINNKDAGSFEVTRANVWAQVGWEGKEELFYENHPYELGVVNYDFTNLNSKVIAFISGHEHGDYQGYDDGILHITTTSDKVDTADYRLWYAYKKLPKEYSKDEFAIDFVSIDCEDDIVSLSRIGRGYGRIFNIGKNTVGVGSSITLTSSLLGSLSWYSYNHDSVFVRREDGYMGYENTRVSVNNGIVTGIQSGESVVFCQDSSGQMEFFDVLVEN